MSAGFCLSGRQDSNLRPPGPKPGALTGLRYAPRIIFNDSLSFSDWCLRLPCVGGRYAPNVFLIVAVRGGFEPPVPVSKYAGLANRWFQPLTHLTVGMISIEIKVLLFILPSYVICLVAESLYLTEGDPHRGNPLISIRGMQRYNFINFKCQVFNEFFNKNISVI